MNKTCLHRNEYWNAYETVFLSKWLYTVFGIAVIETYFPIKILLWPGYVWRQHCRDVFAWLLLMHKTYFFLCAFVPLFLHDGVIKWKYFPCHWPFVRRIHRSPVNSPHKGQWSGALMLSLICAWINGGVNNRDAGDLRRQRAHYDVNVMLIMDVIASTPFRDKLNTIIVQNGAMKCVSFINWYIHRRVLHTLDVAAEYGLTGHFRWRGPIEITWRDSVDMPSFPIYRKCLGVWFALKQIARGSKCPIEWCLRIDIGMKVS